MAEVFGKPSFFSNWLFTIAWSQDARFSRAIYEPLGRPVLGSEHLPRDWLGTGTHSDYCNHNRRASADAAAASGISNILRNLGGAVGTATLGTVLTKREQYHLNVIVQFSTLSRDEVSQRLDHDRILHVIRCL